LTRLERSVVVLVALMSVFLIYLLLSGRFEETVLWGMSGQTLFSVLAILSDEIIGLNFVRTPALRVLGVVFMLAGVLVMVNILL